MFVPYIVASDNAITVHCKGCGVPLHERRVHLGGRTVSTQFPEYGDLYIAMREESGLLSNHSTPCCPSCAADPHLDLDAWYMADVLQWFVEHLTDGQPEPVAESLVRPQTKRRAIRVVRYVPGS